MQYEVIYREVRKHFSEFLIFRNIENLKMSVSSMSGLSKQNQKKMIQMLVRKTHFTEAEVGKLLDCHYQIMVRRI